METNIDNYYQLIFKKIFTLSNSILAEYKTLLHLDKSGQKGSKEYLEHYQKLQVLLSQEHDIYETLQKNSDITKNLLRKLSYFNKRANDFIIPENINSMIYTRMSLKLAQGLNETRNKSLEVYDLFNKFDILSTIHFETLLLSLILFKKYLEEEANSILEDILLSSLYNYAFMFPYIEDILFPKKFIIPTEIYSIVDYLKVNSSLNDYDIYSFKNQKFEQIKKYLNENSVSYLNYVFLLFYLKGICPDNEKTKELDIESLIKKSPLNRNIRKDIIAFFKREDTAKLIRKISAIW